VSETRPPTKPFVPVQGAILHPRSHVRLWTLLGGCCQTRERGVPPPTYTQAN